MYTLKISNHAVQKYSIRTGTSLLKAYDSLKSNLSTATKICLEDACIKFPITSVQAGDSYLTWYNKTIKEHLLAIIRKDGMLVTVLTENILDYNKKVHSRCMVKKGVIHKIKNLKLSVIHIKKEAI